MSLAIISGHRQVPPPGLNGGGAGKVENQLFIKVMEKNNS